MQCNALVSIIIPTVRQTKTVEDCLVSLNQNTVWPGRQIVVVDDGSAGEIQEQLKKIASKHGCELVLKPKNTGFAAAVNCGAETAKGDYLCLVNNDVRFFRPDWLTKMLETAKEPRVGVVGARLLYPDGRIQHAGVRYLPDLGTFEHIDRYKPGDHPSALSIRDVLAVTGALMLTRRSVWQQLGGMAEDYFIALEDVDYCLRAWQHGWRVVYCGKAAACHVEGLTRGTTPQNKDPYWYLRELEGMALFRKKWFDPRRRPRFKTNPAAYSGDTGRRSASDSLPKRFGRGQGSLRKSTGQAKNKIQAGVIPE